MKLIAKKPCSFGGMKFYIGEEIPAKKVLDPKAQEKRGVLAIVNGDAGTAPPVNLGQFPGNSAEISVVIHGKEGDMPLALTAEGLQSVVDVLTENAADAEPIIEEMTDGDALILLHLTDTRKTIKEAAKARAKALSAEPEESAGEQ